MKIIKIRLLNKMKDEFFTDNLFIYIKKEIIKNFSCGPIIDEFKNIKE